MKRHGFTLIELLVVLVIIGALVGLLLPAVIRTMERGRRAKSETQKEVLTTAIKGFVLEYGVLPVDPNLLNEGGSDLEWSSTNWEVFRNLIRGGEWNDRDIVFFDPSEFATGSNGQLLDPWGGDYRVRLDTNGNGSPVGGATVWASK